MSGIGCLVKEIRARNRKCPECKGSILREARGQRSDGQITYALRCSGCSREIQDDG